MKKIWLIGLSMLMMFGLLGCGSDTGKAEQKASAPAPQKVAETAAPAAKGKILVAYFSATGNTKQLAEGAAKALGADLYEVRPAKPYTSDDLNYNDESTRATVEQKNDQARPELADKNAPVANYDTIVLAYPIWWGQAPRLMDTFVESYDFTGITLIPFCTSGSSGIGRSGSNMESLAGAGTWLEGQRFSGNVSEADLKSWIESLK